MQGEEAFEACVALVAGTALNDFVSYRIRFIGDNEQRIVFAPGNYGNKWLLIRTEFIDKGRGYFPPISFMTDYCYPQMLLWYINETNKWNFEWGCEFVDVKDLKGNYIS